MAITLSFLFGVLIGCTLVMALVVSTSVDPVMWFILREYEAYLDTKDAKHVKRHDALMRFYIKTKGDTYELRRRKARLKEFIKDGE